MAIIKYLVSVLLFVAVSSAFELGYFDLEENDLIRVDKHNLAECDPKETDSEILDRFYVSAKGKLFQKVEDSVTWPRSGVANKVITCIRATDLVGHGHGGYPVVEKGGLCMREVTLHFTSQWNRGFKFEVEIWGRDPK